MKKSDGAISPPRYFFNGVFGLPSPRTKRPKKRDETKTEKKIGFGFFGHFTKMFCGAFELPLSKNAQKRTERVQKQKFSR
jgi:hypothetical protein